MSLTDTLTIAHVKIKVNGWIGNLDTSLVAAGGASHLYVSLWTSGLLSRNEGRQPAQMTVTHQLIKVLHIAARQA